MVVHFEVAPTSFHDLSLHAMEVDVCHSAVLLVHRMDDLYIPVVVAGNIDVLVRCH